MRREDHERLTQEVLGEPFTHVHAFMDELRAQHGHNHRQYRHHAEYVEIVRATHGDAAALAAKLHIYQDLAIPNRVADARWVIPADPRDFLRKGWI